MTTSEDELLERAALRIQCVFRCARARRAVASKRTTRASQFQEQCDRDLMEQAAITLQAAQRRMAAKKRVDARRRGSSFESGDASRPQGDMQPSASPTDETAPHLSVAPPSLRASHEAAGSGDAPAEAPSPTPLGGTASSGAGLSSNSFGPRKNKSVVFARGADAPASVGDGFVVDTDRTAAEVIKSGVFESSAQFMSASVYSRVGLTTAFALSSVASFASLKRDDPAAAKEVVQWDPSMLHPTLIHECAAVVLQCKWRVYSAKQRMLQLKRQRAETRHAEDQHQLEEVSALAIQRNFRGHLVRQRSGDHEQAGDGGRPRSAGSKPGPKEFGSDQAAPRRSSVPSGPLTQEQAALRIQCMQRSHAARAETQRRREARAAEFAQEIDASRQEDAARLIQANQRRHIQQRRFKDQLERTRSGEPSPPPQGAAPAAAGGAGGASSHHHQAFPAKLRADVEAAATIPAGSGVGLSALFFTACGQLLDTKAAVGRERTMFWGVRILHAVTMDLAMEAMQSGDASRLPSLEVTRWVQGPLGSVLPMTQSVAAGRSPRSTRLPSLEHQPSPGPHSAGEPSPEATRSGRRLEPLGHERSRKGSTPTA